MPAPPAAQLQGLARAAMLSAGLKGQDTPAMADALGDSTAQALGQFLSMAMVLPGTPAAIDPISGSGATTGPGTLLPAPAGGPGAPQIEPLVQAALLNSGLRGQDAPKLGAAYAGLLAQAIALFTSTVKVAPGIAVAGFVTTAPGALLPPTPQKGALEPLAQGLLTAQGLQGQNIPDLAGAVAELVAQALLGMHSMVLVSPGVAVAPGATAAPGRLM